MSGPKKWEISTFGPFQQVSPHKTSDRSGWWDPHGEKFTSVFVLRPSFLFWVTFCFAAHFCLSYLCETEKTQGLRWKCICLNSRSCSTAPPLPLLSRSRRRDVRRGFWGVHSCGPERGNCQKLWIRWCPPMGETTCQWLTKLSNFVFQWLPSGHLT